MVCTNVTPRCIHATIAGGRKQGVLHILCVCNPNQLANRMCCIVLSPVACVALHHIFQHHLTNSIILEKKKKNITEHGMCVLLIFQMHPII
jgi:hypothetical protein